MYKSSMIAGIGLVVLGAAGSIACTDDDRAGPTNAPPSHTVIQDGVPHAPGLNDPMQNCTSCHGSDLRGGADGQPSCFTCHGQKWP